MRAFTLKALSEALITIGLVLAATSIAGFDAKKARALPIETSNSPIFKQDYTLSVGADANINRTATQSRQYNAFKDNLFVGKDKLLIREDGILTFADGRPYVESNDKNQFIFKQLNHGQYNDIIVDKDKIHLGDDGRIANVDPAGANVLGIAQNLVGTCNGGQLIGQNCVSNSKYTDLTAFGQGAVRTGGNTAILAGYDSNGRTVYGAGALKLDKLALTAGADRFGLTGSAAYSIGSFSPFVAYQRGLTNVGADLRLSDNFSINGGYRSDSSYFAGVRLDIGGDFVKAAPAVAAKPVQKGFIPKPPAPPMDFTCGAGYKKFQDTCVRDMPPAPVRDAKPAPAERAPNGYIRRARG